MPQPVRESSGRTVRTDCTRGLNETDTLARGTRPGRDELGRRPAREPPALAREMRLVRIAGSERALRQLPVERQEPLEPQHARQGLGPVADRVDEAPPQLTLADTEVESVDAR